MRPGLAVLVALFLLAAPAPAAASSIVLVRDGDLWLATPDGGFERRLTVGGGYDSPSMDDTGTIVALQRGSFVRLRGNGAMIGEPVPAVGGDWLVANGPFDARVSADGLKIAYWFTGRRRLCLPLEPGCSLQDADNAAYAHTGRVTDPLELGVVRDYREPSWLGSSRAVLFRYATGTGETVAVNRVGGGEAERQGWFSYDDGTQLGQGQVSSGGDKLAALAGPEAIICSACPRHRRPCRRCAASFAAAASPPRRGRPTAACSRGPRATASMSRGPSPTCARRSRTAA